MTPQKYKAGTYTALNASPSSGYRTGIIGQFGIYIIEPMLK